MAVALLMHGDLNVTDGLIRHRKVQILCPAVALYAMSEGHLCLYQHQIL